MKTFKPELYGVNKEPIPRSGCRLPILHPFGSFHCVWDILIILVLVYSCFEVPVTLAFNLELSLHHPLGILSFSMDCSLLLDIVVTFRTAYYNKWDHLNLVRDPKSIAIQYLKGWFFIDLLTSLPFEFIVEFVSVDTYSDTVIFGLPIFDIFRLLRFVRIIKMLRLFKMMRIFDDVVDQIAAREFLIFLKFLKVFFLMLTVTHLAACLWFFVGYKTMDSATDSWLSNKFGTKSTAEIDQLDAFAKYSYSWYWAVVTLFTTGYGDIAASDGNLWEHWVATLTILVGTCVVAYFIGNVTSLITEGDRVRSAKLQKLEEAKAFIHQKNLSPKLSRAILSNIRYHCRYNYVFNETDLFDSLPLSLQNEIHEKMAKSMLSQLEFFKSFTKSKSALRTLGQIAAKTRSISCPEGECLFTKGDRAKEIYIQRTGVSEIEFADGSTRQLSPGDVIGADCISWNKRTCTVRCETFGEFYALAISDVWAMLQNEYPKTWTTRCQMVTADYNASVQQHGPNYVGNVKLENDQKTKSRRASKAVEMEQLRRSHHADFLMTFEEGQGDEDGHGDGGGIQFATSPTNTQTVKHVANHSEQDSYTISDDEANRSPLTLQASHAQTVPFSPEAGCDTQMYAGRSMSMPSVQSTRLKSRVAVVSKSRTQRRPPMEKKNSAMRNANILDEARRRPIPSVPEESMVTRAPSAFVAGLEISEDFADLDPGIDASTPRRHVSGAETPLARRRMSEIEHIGNLQNAKTYCRSSDFAMGPMGGRGVTGKHGGRMDRQRFSRPRHGHSRKGVSTLSTEMSGGGILTSMSSGKISQETYASNGAATVKDEAEDLEIDRGISDMSFGDDPHRSVKL